MDQIESLLSNVLGVGGKDGDGLADEAGPFRQEFALKPPHGVLVRHVTIGDDRPDPWQCPRPAVVDADNRGMRMRGAHGLGKQWLPEWIVQMEADISCVASLPGRLGVTVERAGAVDFGSAPSAWLVGSR